MLYILLPVHNRKSITQKWMRCLKKQTFQDFQLILIDDGSTDETDKMVMTYSLNTHIIYGDGSLWWAGALQKGYEYLSVKNLNATDCVLLINDDVEFERDFLQTAINIMHSKNNTLLKAWSIDKYSHKKWDGYIAANLKKLTFHDVDNDSLVNCASTRGLFLKATDFISTGGFAYKKLPHYLSDYEFTIRAVQQGYKIYCDDTLQLVSDSKESGYNIIHYQTLRGFTNYFFSVKCPNNPKYLINFVKLTATNNFYKTFNIVKIILKSGIKICTALVFLLVGKKSINIGSFLLNFKQE